MRRGFSLVELAIVIAIMAVLATGVYLFAGGSVDRSRIAKTESVIAKLKTAIDNYYADTGYFPSSAKQFWNNSAGAPGWSGPYVDAPNGDTNLDYFPHAPWGGTGKIACSDGDSVSLVMENMPKGLCQKLDDDMDDGNLSSGLVRWNSSDNTCVYYYAVNDSGVRCK